jgi:MFS family permease
MPSQRLYLVLVAARFVCLYVTYFYLPLYLQQAGITGFLSGLLLSMFAITGLLSAFGAGVLTDRYPIRRLAAVGFLLLALFNLGLTQALGAGPLLGMFVVGGLGNTILEISLTSFVLKTTDEGRAGAGFGRYYAVLALSAAAGMIIGGQLLTSLGYAATFGLAGAAFAVCAGAALGLPATARGQAPIQAYVADLRSRDLLVGCLGFVAISLHWGAEVTTLTPFLRDNVGLDPPTSGLFLGTAVLGLATGGVLAGWALDRGHRLAAIACLGLTLGGLGHVGALVSAPVPAWVIRLLHESGDGLAGVANLYLLRHLFPVDRLGGLASFVSTVMILGRFSGTLIFAPLGAAQGHQWPLVVSGVLLLGAILPLLPLYAAVDRGRREGARLKRSP